MLQDFCAGVPLEQKIAPTARFVQNLLSIYGSARILSGDDATIIDEAAKSKAAKNMDNAFRNLANKFKHESLISGTNIKNEVRFIMYSIRVASETSTKCCLEPHENIIKGHKFQTVRSAYVHQGQSEIGKLGNLNDQFLMPMKTVLVGS
ncbi:hypothetical protein ABW19_dt0201749 [Dactylella cylindrospora]|nr:hypothetical protein ABW19_dt0201749 [Dactylella cylindrospora]